MTGMPHRIDLVNLDGRAGDEGGASVSDRLAAALADAIDALHVDLIHVELPVPTAVHLGPAKHTEPSERQVLRCIKAKQME